MRVEMRLGAIDGNFRLAVDDRGHHLDMADFPRCRAGHELSGMRRHRTGFLALHIELMQAGPCDMRQREARVLPPGAIEGGPGAGPVRKQDTTTSSVIR